MNLDELVGDAKNLKEVFGEKALNSVRAEARLINALSKYDIYLDTLNSEIKAYVDEITKPSTGPKQSIDQAVSRIQHDKLSRDISQMTKYLREAYTSIYESLVCDRPEELLRISDADMDANAANWYKSSEQVMRVIALNSTGALNDAKIRYLFDPDSL